MSFTLPKKDPLWSNYMNGTKQIEDIYGDVGNNPNAVGFPSCGGTKVKWPTASLYQIVRGYEGALLCYSTNDADRGWRDSRSERLSSIQQIRFKQCKPIIPSSSPIWGCKIYVTKTHLAHFNIYYYLQNQSSVVSKPQNIIPETLQPCIIISDMNLWRETSSIGVEYFV